MSWQAYIDDNMMAENKLQHAAILSREDGSVWAQSEKFPELSDAEFKTLVNIFEKPDERGAQGVTLGGTKYHYLGGEENTVIRIKLGAGGGCIKMTKQIILIGIYGEGTAPSECNLIVENLGDYFLEQDM
eukprot:TRINITY_DN204_c0_g1_i1.p8 TRINITY_DN204_c0_g1~~TRINITY_DN204_c0_g1_i1.p8  ORF type:complete len:130 (-),score=21.68 TRINITY_DN204_c0_g1_i1:346-735(-)